MEWGGAARTRHKFSGVRRRPPQRTVWGPARAASSSSVPWDVVWRAPKSPRARKVAFGAQKSLFRSKVTFGLRKSLFTPKSLFRSKSHFSRFRPLENVKIYKHYKGLAAVARAGAKKADFAEFSGTLTFGAKMVPKVTFSDFLVPKATCRAKARRCACSQRFLDVFCGPRERKCHFCVQTSLFDTFSTLAPKSHFLAEK